MASIALFAAACSSSATATPLPTSTPEPTPTPTPRPSDTDLNATETEYLDQVRAAIDLFAAKNEAFGDAFGQTWAIPQRLFDTLQATGAGTAFVESLEALEQLEPPERLRADHRRMVETYRELVRVDAEIGLAVANQDLIELNLLNSQLGEISGLNAVGLSAAVCDAVTDPDSPVNVCAPSEPLPGGEYGAQLNVTVRRFQALFLAYTSSAVGPVLPEDLLSIASVQQPKVIGLFQEILDGVKRLSPPADLVADHAVLTQYFEDSLAATLKMSSAVETGDSTMLLGEIFRSAQRLCETLQKYSPAFKPLVRAHFEGSPEICNGPPSGGSPPPPPPG